MTRPDCTPWWMLPQHPTSHRFSLIWRDDDREGTGEHSISAAVSSQLPASSAAAFQASGWGNTSRAGQSVVCHPPMVPRLFKASIVPSEQQWLQVGCHTTCVSDWEAKGVT